MGTLSSLAVPGCGWRRSHMFGVIRVRITNTLKEGFIPAECCEVLDL